MLNSPFVTSAKVKPESLRPTEDHVLIRQIDKWKSGHIILPKGEKTECYFGEVVRVGSGGTASKTGAHLPIPFIVGEILLVMRYAGQDVELDDDGEFKMIREHSVWARGIKMDDDKNVTDLEPYGDKLVVTVRYDRKTTGGIFLPERENNHPNVVADVVKVGPGGRSLSTGRVTPNSVSVGDAVVMERYHGADVKIKGVKHRVCQDKDLCAIVKGLKE